MKTSWQSLARFHLLCIAAVFGLLPACLAEDLLIGDFRGASFGAWVTTGTAFGSGPTSGSLLPKLEIENAPDDSAASSEIEGDKPTGTLTSPPFKIQRKYISFLVAGGDYERDTCLNLLIGDKVVRSATGWRSDRLTPVSWDVGSWAGQTAQVQLVDQATGDWGHINVAHIVQTDAPARLPVVDQPLYRESLRPQFHFTARQWTVDRLNPRERQEGWINDLNGLIFYEGEYHLFAQRWAKCWLHAVSRDLIHWTELDPAFWEEQLDSGVQSGSCVIDYQNTSGLGIDPARPPMVAFWSRFDNRSQCVSYSLDHGRTWKLYEHNPIMDRPERDPKVFWYGPRHHWVMMMYGNNQYHILTSTNLLNWKDEKHPIHDSFECPDFFELPLDSDRNRARWVLIQGSGKYSIGSFDGTEFKEETERRVCDIGDFYATQTWGNVETGDGRRIQAAWVRFSHFPDMPFSQQVSFPCELTLRTTPQGLRLFRQPISEVVSLHHGEDAWTNRLLSAGQVLPLQPAGRLFHVQASVEIPDGAKLTFNVRGIPVVIGTRTIDCSAHHGVLPNVITAIEILVDRTSIETFLNQGELSCTSFVLPKESGVSLKAEGAAVKIHSLHVWRMSSAWPGGISD